MSDVIYTWHAPGTAAEGIVVDMRNGLVRITVRGEPAITPAEDLERGWTEKVVPGPTAVMTLSLSVAADLTQALLRAPPVADMIGKVPHVIFFDSIDDRDAFIDEAMRVNSRLADPRAGT